MIGNRNRFAIDLSKNTLAIQSADDAVKIALVRSSSTCAQWLLGPEARLVYSRHFATIAPPLHRRQGAWVAVGGRPQTDQSPMARPTAMFSWWLMVRNLGLLLARATHAILHLIWMKFLAAHSYFAALI
jgi:hypothetical protein